MKNNPDSLIVALGPTASGKTPLGVAPATRLTGEAGQVTLALQQIESVGGGL